MQPGAVVGKSRAEAAGFAVLIVADKDLRLQHNLSAPRIAILELRTNHPPALETHFQERLLA